MRTLVVIPIVHTEQDMGSLLEQTKQAYVSRFGHDKWIEHLKSIDDVWLGIHQMIKSLELPLCNGTPVSGRLARLRNAACA